jgi:sporulation protein YlmC with PRC-barrel domain
MKIKTMATMACLLPFALASAAYAQTGTASGASDTPAATPAPPAATHSAAPVAQEPEQTRKITGMSVKDDAIGTSVYNDKGTKIGDIDDVILAQDGKAAWFVVGAGGFLGLGQHDVAIPYEKMTKENDKFLLEGYTKEQLKAMPAVDVRKKAQQQQSRQ